MEHMRNKIVPVVSVAVAKNSYRGAMNRKFATHAAAIVTAAAILQLSIREEIRING